MQPETTIIHGDSLAALGLGPLAVALGVFDGVHRGHQRLLDALAGLAKQTNATPVALTFDPHPRSVLHPDEPTRLLLPPRVRAEFLLHYGARKVLVYPFTPAFSACTAESFLDTLFASAEITGICVGANWRFGAKGAGNAAMLKSYTAKHGARTIPVPEVEYQKEPISSSRIRRLVAAGRLDDAAELLGRPYRLYGTVEHGKNFAGPGLGCPTANLALEHGILPPDGVYAARVFLPDAREYPAAVNLGFSPTFQWAGVGRRLELHLLDYSGDLYGKELSVELIAHLRPECVFSGPAELTRQIEIDIRNIRNLFTGTLHA